MIRIGILGCGRILNAHLQGFARLVDAGLDNFRIAALVSRREEDAWMFHTRGKGPTPRPPVSPPGSGDPLAASHTYVSDFQDATDLRVYSDYRRMIDDGVVDVVLDTTPVYLHHQAGLALLDAGSHVLTQKPLAISVRAARLMVERARSKNVVLGTFENARYKPLARAVRWAFETGVLGSPQMALVGGIGGRWSPDIITADTPWRHQKLLAGGGGSLDIGVHHMNLLRYVMGEIRSVQAVVRCFEPRRQGLANSALQMDVDVDDTYFASVEFENGAIGQLLWSWAGHGPELAITAAPAFYGSQGCVQADRLFVDGRDGELLLDCFEKECDAAWRERVYPCGLDDPFAVLQHDWLRAIADRNFGMETCGEEGLRDLAAAFAILESAQQQRAVTLDEVLDGNVASYQQSIDEHYGLPHGLRRAGQQP